MRNSRFLLSVTRGLSLTLCLALAACGGGTRIHPEDRAAIHTGRTIPPEKGARGDIYADATSNAVRGASAAFGLAGALIGGTIAAANTKAGVRRWESVTRGLPELVVKNLRSELERQFTIRHGIKFPASGPTDAEIKLDRVVFGVEHLGKQQFGATVSAEIIMNRLHEGKKEEVWFNRVPITVPIGASLEECQRNPRPYVAALEEAIRQLVAKALGEY